MAEVDRKICYVDLRDHKSHISMNDNLDLPMSPIKQPSKIQIMDSKERYYHFSCYDDL